VPVYADFIPGIHQKLKEIQPFHGETENDGRTDAEESK
jgi:hypothetical protein